MVCTGQRGWHDYLLLHHYDPAEIFACSPWQLTMLEAAARDGPHRGQCGSGEREQIDQERPAGAGQGEEPNRPR